MMLEEKPLYTVEDDDNPLYNIDDDNDSTLTDDEDGMEDSDDSGDVEDPENPEDEPKKSFSPVGVLFKTMMTPVEGWKQLKRARFTDEEFAGRCFYPLTALAAISEGSALFYEANVTMADWAMQGLSTFITFFFGYFSVILAGGFLLPKAARFFVHKDVGRQSVMLAMSTLALFQIAINVVPMLDPVLVFLPLWTIYLLYKGVRVIRVPKDVENSTTGIVCALVIGMPLLWNWLMTEVLLPSA